MSHMSKGIKSYLCFGLLKKIIVYTQIVLQTLLGTLPLYTMSFSTQANSDVTKKHRCLSNFIHSPPAIHLNRLPRAMAYLRMSFGR
ncbi:putative adhesin [Yersinia frederiksenii]|nr:putative adhesin [Yersinia frederiksenii]